MEGNLLLEIQKHRPRENKNPKENFFTEILSYLLNNDSELLFKFCNLFYFTESQKNLKIQTQAYHKGKYIDLEICNETKKLFIFVENKIDSKAGYKQLENYIDILKKISKKGYLIFLTKYNESISKDVKKFKNFKHIYWEDVFKIFKEHLEENNKDNNNNNNKIIEFLLSEFIKLMEYENMKPFEKINEKSMNEASNFINNIKKLFIFLEKELNLKKTKFGMALNNRDEIGEIQLSFTKTEVTCYLNYDFDFKKFYFIIRKNTLPDPQIVKRMRKEITDESMKIYNKLIVFDFEPEEKFFNSTGIKQKEILKKFYKDKINLIDSIIFSKN